jgi:hypothetical protein
MGGKYGIHGGMRTAYILVGRPEGKRRHEDLRSNGGIILK